MIKDEWTRDLSKRFYESVEVRPEGKGHTVLLDGRAVHTPLKRPLVVPTEALAGAIAAEWEAQEGHVVPATMPITKLTNTSIDHSAEKADAIVEEFRSYAGSDLLCYRADTPEGLVERQKAHWDPILAWAGADAGAELLVTAGIVHRPQPERALDALRQRAAACDAFELTAVQTLTALTGSAVLALAVAARAIEPKAAWVAANVDEDWQIELWGWDAEAERRRAFRRREFDTAVQFLELLRG